MALWRSRLPLIDHFTVNVASTDANDYHGGGEEGGVQGDEGEGELPKEGELWIGGKVQGQPKPVCVCFQCVCAFDMALFQVRVESRELEMLRRSTIDCALPR